MTVLDGQDPGAVQAAARRLAAGDLVAFPTETVYGLGARADDDGAVRAIFATKGRPIDHPLIVHVQDVGAARAFAADWPPAAQALAEHFWPGPVTVIVARRSGVAEAASGGHPTIGLRCPSHPVARALMHEAYRLGVPGIAGPSANRFGRVSPTCAAHVQQEFGDALTVLDGGPCPVGIESAVVDCSGPTPALLRPGTSTRAQIDAALQAGGLRPLQRVAQSSTRAPGTLASHYAPSARVRLCSTLQLAGMQPPDKRVGVYSRVLPEALSGQLHRPMPDDPAMAARELFHALREFDSRGVSEIWVEQPPPDPVWEGVLDRLRRAAHE